MIFKDRIDAGYKLAEKLEKYKNSKDTIILAIPRGAIEIGNVLAKELGLPLDIVLTKKIGAPGHSEYAIGSVSLDSYVVEPIYEINFKEYIEHEVKNIQLLLKKRYEQYKGDENPPDLKNKTVIIIDDGVATGRTIISAIDLIRKKGPKKIIVALPVSSKDAMEKIEQLADEVICLYTPEVFYAVGQFYENFDQVEDEDAIKLLKEANK